MVSLLDHFVRLAVAISGLSMVPGQGLCIELHGSGLQHADLPGALLVRA